MKILSFIMKIFSIVFFLYAAPLVAGNITDGEPAYDKVYRTDRVADSYHFFLISKNGNYYYLHTNKTNTLTAEELKSPNLMSILDQKQSWGQAFPDSGQYTEKNGKLYTKRYWDLIKVFNTQKVKYLNKVFHLQ